jgi:hypothetical protein
MGLFEPQIIRSLQRGETSGLVSSGGLTVLENVGVILTDRAVVDLLGDSVVPLSTNVSLHDLVSAVAGCAGANQVTQIDT